MSSKAERANWPVRKVRIGIDEDEDPSAHLTPEEQRALDDALELVLGL